MARITWGKPGEKTYQTGLDRGVLYPNNSEGVPWNGLISVDKAVSGGEASAYYFDGIKYFDEVAGEDFKATLTAFTYPFEFEACQGYVASAPGLILGLQARQTFGLAWRTNLGDDLKGIDKGYRIHIVYNATATPSPTSHKTIGENVDPNNFQWEINATPPIPGAELIDPNTNFLDWVWPEGYGMNGWPMGPDGNTPVPGWRATAYIIVDSVDVPSDVLTDLEDKLYGTPDSPAYLPLQIDVVKMLNGHNVPIKYNFPWTKPIDPSDPGGGDPGGGGGAWALTKNLFPDPINSFGRATVRGDLVAVQYSMYDGTNDASRIVVGRLNGGSITWGTPLDIPNVGYACYWVYDDVFVDTNNSHLISYKVDSATLSVTQVSMSVRPTDVGHLVSMQPFVNEVSYKVYMYTNDPSAPKAWEWFVNPDGTLDSPALTRVMEPIWWSDSNMVRLSPTEYVAQGGDATYAQTDLVRFDLAYGGEISRYGTVPEAWGSVDGSNLDAQDPAPGNPIVQLYSDYSIRVMTPNGGPVGWSESWTPSAGVNPQDAAWTPEKTKVVGWFYDDSYSTVTARWDVFGTSEDIPVTFPDWTRGDRPLMVAVPNGFACFFADDQWPHVNTELWVWQR